MLTRFSDVTDWTDLTGPASPEGSAVASGAGTGLMTRDDRIIIPSDLVSAHFFRDLRFLRILCFLRISPRPARPIACLPRFSDDSDLSDDSVPASPEGSAVASGAKTGLMTRDDRIIIPSDLVSAHFFRDLRIDRKSVV